MNTKFTKIIESNYQNRLDVISRISDLTEEIGRLLSKYHNKHRFYVTAIQFAKVAVETPNALIMLATAGHISQAYIILRWYLEMSHLIWYLWNNPTCYKDWLNGLQIRPKHIGKFFAKRKIPTWKETYDEWCNVVHGNSSFMEYYHNIAMRTPTSEGQKLIVGNILVNIAFITQKINWFLIEIIREAVTPEEWHEIYDPCEVIDRDLKPIYEEQLRDENKLMNN